LIALIIIKKLDKVGKIWSMRYNIIELKKPKKEGEKEREKKELKGDFGSYNSLFWIICSISNIWYIIFSMLFTFLIIK